MCRRLVLRVPVSVGRVRVAIVLEHFVVTLAQPATDADDPLVSVWLW